MPEFKHVVILSDGIRGHYHQSLGVAEWLSRLCGAKVEPMIEVPKVSGLRKLMMKLSARKIPYRDAKYSRKWLETAGIEAACSPDTLFISAGSTAAPYCLALARATGNKSAVIMTPSILGTRPFDFAIIPEHDAHDVNSHNILTTLGAPNHIYTPDLHKIGEVFFAHKDLTHGKVVAVLVGGSDANYKISPEWAVNVLGPLRYIEGIKILLTTSRRTGEAVDDEIERLFTGTSSLEYMLLMSKNSALNSITAMLGMASHVLVTEDSVSMVSEAVTAGFKVGLIRVPRVTGHVKGMLGFGAQRFDELFAKMKAEGLIDDLGENPDFGKFMSMNEQRHHIDFNEAKRAAEWIIARKV